MAITKYSTAQEWTNNIKNENPTFYDIQNAFNDYWEPFNVKNGKYKLNGEEHKAYGWKQFKRWEWYWKQRVGSSGKFPKNTVIWDEWEKQEKLKTPNNSSKKLNTWTPKGPYDKSVYGLGRINCMAFHPTNPNIFWVGTPAGGLWKTTNGGSTWSPIGDNLPVLGVSSIAINPTNPNIMYIATGDGEGAFSLSAFGMNTINYAGDTKSVGILKSIDGGSTWATVLSAQQFDGVLIRKIVINPNNPNYLFAATNFGIFRTDDGGITWTQPQTDYFIDIEFNPGNTDIMYASTFDNGGNAQVYVTTDIGVTWTQTTSFTGINRIEIAVTPNSVNAVDLLCSKASDNGLYGMYFSNNSGATWSFYYNGSVAGQNLLGWYDNGSQPKGQGSYDLAYVIDPYDWNTAILGGVNTFKTTNGWATKSISNIWTSSPPYNTTGSTQIVHADKHFFAYHPLVPNTLFECNDGGIYKSTNGGSTWVDITNGMQISQFYSISSSQTNSAIISGGRQDNGSLVISSGTEVAMSGGDGMITHIDYSDYNYLYTSYVNGKIYRVISSPYSVDTISDNIPDTGTGVWLTPYLIDPTTPTTLYAGYSEVFKSTNRGNTWAQISNFGFGVGLNYLSVAPTNSNYIYAAWPYAIYMTSNGGATWSNITGALPVSNQFISSIKVDPTNANSVAVTFSGYTANEKVFVTVNAGTSWINATNTGLPNLPVNCVEMDKYGGDLYVGTDLGVYIYDGSLGAWSQYGTGLPNVVVTDLDIQYSSSKLRVGTFGRGIWETDLNTPFVQSPTASFTSNLTSICVTGCINFTDNSTNAPTSWSWSFPGGTPSSSVQQNPTNICYSNSGTYNVSLISTNTGGSDTITMINYVTINPLPTNAGSISGTTTVCQGQNTVNYTVPTIANATSYIWSLPSGASGTSTTNSITVNYGTSAISGNITVKGTNSCGNGATSTLVITVNSTPTTPIISLTGNDLQSNSATGNQWYDQNGLISGATNQNYTATVNGNYYVIVTLLGCSSDASNTINVILTSTDVVENSRTIKIYPNPVSNELIIEIEGNNVLQNYEILNAIGQVILKGEIIDRAIVQTNHFTSGVYFVKLENGKTFEFKKIIKE